MEGATTRPARRERRRCFAASVAAAALAVGTWGWGVPHVLASDEEAFKSAYEAAAAARKAARKAGFEWRDTRKMLRQARKLAKKGEYSKAIELANRAKRQGELGMVQAEEQETAWRAAVLK